MKCDQCGDDCEKPFQCSRCESVVYCGTACQKAHWKAGHKSVCRKKSTGTHGGGAERLDSQNGFSGGPQCTTLVSLYVYDLSQGFAKRMSQSLLADFLRCRKPGWVQIDGVWHTSVVVFGKEFFFGGGIQSEEPGQTAYGTPVDRISLGETSKTVDNFLKFLEVRSLKFSADTYDLLTNNCNHFSNECALFLTSSPIPAYITDLPSEVINSPIGAMVQPILQQLHSRGGAGAGAGAGGGGGGGSGGVRAAAAAALDRAARSETAAAAAAAAAPLLDRGLQALRQRMSQHGGGAQGR